MLQMNQYQEHCKNPELATLKVGNKHPCPVCLKLFTRKRDVQYHISRVHVGERKFPCSVCGKKFKENTHLTVHMRSHTGSEWHQLYMVRLKSSPPSLVNFVLAVAHIFCLNWPE